MRYRAWFEAANLKKFRLEGKKAHALCPLHADTSPSLSIDLETGWCRCYGACNESWPAHIFAAKAGLPLEGLPSRNGSASAGKPGPRKVPVAEWIYTDTGGAPVLKVTRFPDHPDGRKDILQSHWEDGRWVYGTRRKDGRRVKGLLYNLQRLHQADPSEPVWLVEGEKDADNGASLGLLTTTTPGGASAFGQTDPRCLSVVSGRRVYIVQDNDEAGAKYARAAFLGLRKAGADVRVLAPLPGTKKGGDLSDWCAAGGTRTQLLALAEQASPLNESTPDPEDDGRPAWKIEPAEGVLGYDYLQTDGGNGDFFAALWADQVRYCHPWKAWLIWNGQHWLFDRRGLAGYLATLTARRRLSDAKNAADPKKETCFALASDSGKGRREMLEAAKSRQALVVLPEELDSNPWLLGCQNGTLDLATGKLRPPRREDLLTKAVPVSYDPAARCPLWESFLERVLVAEDGAPDRDLIAYIQRAVGYALSGAIREHALFILYGRGANGKGTFVETLASLLGPDFTHRLRVEVLLESYKSNAGPSPDLADLKGKRLAFTSEVEKGRRLAEALVKELTGNDTINARRLYQDSVSFRPSHKLWFSTNYKPEIAGTDDGIWRRIHLIPFNVCIPLEEQDATLPARLLEELPGILAWAVRGCLAWQEKGLSPPEAVRAATRKYRQDSDCLQEFFQDRCRLHATGKIKSSLLYAAYTGWCSVRNEKAMSCKRFSLALQERGFTSRRSNGIIWDGIDLRDRAEDDTQDDYGVSENSLPPFQDALPYMEESLF